MFNKKEKEIIPEKECNLQEYITNDKNGNHFVCGLCSGYDVKCEGKAKCPFWRGKNE